jgi:hypothetical protein
MSLLPLPPISACDAPLRSSRSPLVIQTVATLHQIYFAATAMLVSGNFDVQRILHHLDLLMKTGLPLLATLESVAEPESIPTEWLHDTAGKLSALLLELLEAEKLVEGECVLPLSIYPNSDFTTIII